MNGGLNERALPEPCTHQLQVRMAQYLIPGGLPGPPGHTCKWSHNHAD